MFDVDTLFVISSKRGNYPLEDLLAAIAWTCTTGSHYTVVVDETGTLEHLEGGDRFQILHSDLPGEVDSGFHRAAGLKWAIDQKIAYKQVIMMADTCLIATQTMDSFFMEHIQRDQIGMIGVRSRRTYEKEWQDAQNQLFEWRLPIEAWERRPASLNDDFLILSGRFAAALYGRGLLVPDGCDKWPATFGSYISWLCHMLDFYVIGWGFEDKALPPIYVNHCHGQYLPPPHLLGNQFLVFSPANAVLSYSEGDLREMYKQRRGERAREVAKFQPVVSGPDQQDVTTTAGPTPMDEPEATPPQQAPPQQLPQPPGS